VAFNGLESINWDGGLHQQVVVDRDLTSLKIMNGEALLFLVTFPTGRYGLSSDERIKSMGIKRRKICDAHFKDACLPASL
jgi:hypothetical protein